MTIRLSGAFGLAVALLLTVGCASLERSARTFVLKDYTEPVFDPTWTHVLYNSLTGADSLDAGMSAFAREIGESEAAARAYAEVIIDARRRASHRMSVACIGHDRVRCRYRPGYRAFDRMAALALEEKSGELLITVAKEVSLTVDRPYAPAAILDLTLRHPEADHILRALYPYASEPTDLAALLGRPPFTTDDAREFAVAYHLYDNHKDWRDGWLLARIETAWAASEAASPEVRAGLSQLFISALLALGLDEEAIAAYDGLDEVVRAKLPLAPGECLATDRHCDDMAEAGYALMDNLAGAYARMGRLSEADELFQVQLPGFRPRWSEAAMRAEALREAMHPSMSPEELDEAFREREPPPTAQPRYARSPRAGLLFNFGDAAPGLSSLVAERLRQAGRDHLSAFLYGGSAFPPNDRNAVMPHVRFLFTEEERRRQAHWAARISAVNARLQALAPAAWPNIDGDGNPLDL